jgi:hypothetical protein
MITKKAAQNGFHDLSTNRDRTKLFRPLSSYVTPVTKQLSRGNKKQQPKQKAMMYQSNKISNQVESEPDVSSEVSCKTPG